MVPLSADNVSAQVGFQPDWKLIWCFCFWIR